MQSRLITKRLKVCQNKVAKKLSKTAVEAHFVNKVSCASNWIPKCITYNENLMMYHKVVGIRGARKNKSCTQTDKWVFEAQAT